MSRKSEITRRRFAVQASALGVALAFGRACAHVPTNVSERRDLFPQGVASGDPAHDSVILWTRRPPVGASSAQRLVVEVAGDATFSHVVARGESAISADLDWTCRFLAAGLRPGREYFYRFVDEQGFASRVGRTLTAPAQNDPRTIKFAFVSCQNVTQGACNAYRRMIFEDEHAAPEERLGFVMHLGDFIYEITWYPEDRPQGMYSRRLRDIVRFPTGEKIHDFHIPVTLEDYRTLYRGYLSDPDLQDARARWPFVSMWDNHEFSWQGYQSQQVFFGETRPAQTKKVMASQAWFEYQPGRFAQANYDGLDRFEAPHVSDTPLANVDAHGVGQEPNNLAAINALRVYRTLKYGANVDLILTDNRSFQSPAPDYSAFGAEGFRYCVPQEAMEIVDGGRGYNNGNPPATIRFNGQDVPNPARDLPTQSFLGGEQKQWLLTQLRASRAPWKIWGHSFGTLVWRTDVQNLPAGVGPHWPGAGYGMMQGEYFIERGEIFDVVRNEGITGLTIVAGDKHSFWAGVVSKDLPPRAFDPVGLEFITGSISAPGLFESATYNVRDDPLRALYLYDPPNGATQPAINMTVLHGVRSALKLAETHDLTQALALSNPEVSPHLSFADLSGHGFATVRCTPTDMQTEFVAIPRPIEKVDAPDGGPLAYRVVHRAQLWGRGERPRLQQHIIEGTPPLAT